MIYNAMTLVEKIKYSGALEAYPFLEEVFKMDEQETDEITEAYREVERLEEQLGNAEMLLHEIYDTLESDDVSPQSYKTLKKKIFDLKYDSNWED